MSFDTDPGEQARISACDLEQMCNEMRRLQHRNAQLEAKAAEAADMLDALEEIARLPIAGSYPDGPCLERQDMNMVRAAIAKATGKEIA
jgi:cell division septum initiation protein DivIVA